MNLKVYQVKVFSRDPAGGNPAGVVMDSEGLTENDMRRIAKKLSFPETAFILKPGHPEADFAMRFFTPSGDEVALCGHATIAAFFTLANENKIVFRKRNQAVMIQETKSGLHEVVLTLDADGKAEYVIAGQNLPELIEERSDWERVAELLNIEREQLGIEELPMQVFSTGLPDLLVPVKNLEAMAAIEPDMEALADYQKSNGFISIHAFTFDTVKAENDLHVRDFAPSVYINEEAATGTANGALSAYLVRNRAVDLDNDEISLKIEQGCEMGSPCEIMTRVRHQNGNIISVAAGGTAVIFSEKLLNL